MNGFDPVQITSKTQTYSLIRGISLTGPLLISVNVGQARQKDFSLMHHSLERRFHLFCYYIHYTTTIVILYLCVN